MPITNQSIRALAICILRRGNEFLVQEFVHDETGKYFYRPVGGGIEFGEYGQDTIRREMQEELNTQVIDIRYETMLENIFTYVQRRGHEVVLVYSARFADETLYEQERLTVVEEGMLDGYAVWKTLEFFKETQYPLYPDGLPEWLETWLAS